jgi:hypothetical protein
MNHLENLTKNPNLQPLKLRYAHISMNETINIKLK